MSEVIYLNKIVKDIEKIRSRLLRNIESLVEIERDFLLPIEEALKKGKDYIEKKGGQ